MKKIVLLFYTLGILTSLSYGQVTDGEAALKTAISNDSIDGWKKGAKVFISVSQTSLTNWSAGGENSLSINGLVSSFANLKKGKLNWDNSLDIGYGLLKQGKDADFVKTDDKVDLLSKLGYDAFKEWNYAALINFKTQITDGYNYPNKDNAISKFLAPAYILGAAGLDYKPSDNFSAFIAPLTGKLTIVNDQTLADSAAFGVDPGEKTRAELGGYIRAAYKKDLMENVSLETKIDLFSNYLNNPTNIDINWETLITLKANEFLSATIATHLVYDDDIIIAEDTDGDGTIDRKGPRMQFKEVLSVGLTLKF